MKHIYIIDEHQSSKQNGVGTYIRQLLKCFEGSGHDVNLLSFNDDKKDFDIEQKTIYTEFHIPSLQNSKFLSFGALTLPILRLYIPDNKDNIFFANHSPSDIFLKILKKLFPSSIVIFTVHDQGWTAPLLGDSIKLKGIISNRRKYHQSIPIDMFIRRYFFRERKMYEIVDKIIVLSTGTYHVLVDIYNVPESKIILIHNAVDITNYLETLDDNAQIRKKLGIREKDVLLIYTGRLAYTKGIYSLLEAFEEICFNYKNLYLVIVGNIHNLAPLVAKVPKSISHIIFTGQLPKKALFEWYKIADIGILPSYTEQCSYTGLEMMAFGKLIVTTNGNGLCDMFTSQYAIIANVNDPLHNDSPCEALAVELKKAIEKALTLPSKEKLLLINRCQRVYHDRFDFCKFRRAYIDLIEINHG